MPTLLVVDDEPAIRELLRRAFCEPEVALRSAASAAEGVDSFSRSRPDVVIMDVNLGSQSGLETFSQLQKIDARVPVIVITGEGSTETAIKAMAQVAYEYLRKPFSLNELRSIVFRAFEVSRLMRVRFRR